MTELDSRNRPNGTVSRRSLLQSTAALLSLPLVTNATVALAREKLAGTGEVVVYSYGGSFTDKLRKSVFDPFTKATGIKVVDVAADLAEPQIKAMSAAKRVDWDAAFVTSQGYPELREAGMFMPIDYSLWDEEALKGVPEFARLTDAVVAFQNATMLVYDQRAFPKGGPKSWADFWNVKQFPGPRGLDASLGYRNMVFALIADGVAHKEIWPLTDDKIERALKKLDEIKPHITKWWTAGGEPMQLLVKGEYALTSAFDGRALAAVQQGQPVRMVWDGANVGDNYWVVLKGGPNSANAQKFIAYVNRAEIAAAFTQGVGYPGPNTNQLKYLPAELIPLISLSPDNAAKTVRLDAAWFSAKRSDGKTNADHIQERWLAWRAR
ncbi:ABC transporter substrate-binding protein [Bradyrhizobium sp. SSUT112]|uniref:ABC transporter substrate-binding protein n=1 Tax=Bradyrhizobium sp. SSUT112 TaxID=3040604 RepID=UPI00244CD60B|nr:ABC transporter substrate-binding protein [Bradyrhizobium sp. SSUT112]MDH2357226.1 ABC transporter substrate-binding protein [Bradyrhizobium sp. SSUT112]